MLQTNVLQPRTLDILKKVMGNPAFSQYILVGGTALALKMGHRLSIDLDFFSFQPIDHEAIKIELEQIGVLSENYRNKIMLRVDVDAVRMDFVTYKFDLLKPLIVSDGIRMASVEDICGMKFEAIKNRGLKKDFYDLYFLLKEFSIKDMLKFHASKYPGTNQFQMLMSLRYFDDADKSESPVLLKDKNVSWQNVKKVIEDALKSVM